jgi:hypothetical protein
VNAALLDDQIVRQTKDLTFKDVARNYDISNIPGYGTPSPGFNQFALQAIADYKELYRENALLLKGGDPTQDGEDIRAAADRDFARVYGVSQLATGTGTFVARGELMKFPPEQAPGYAGVPPEALIENITQHVLDYHGGLEGVDPSTIRLVPINQAGLTAGDWSVKFADNKKPNPRYNIVFEKDVNGIKVLDQVPGAWMMTPQEIENSTAMRERAKARLGTQGVEFGKGLELQRARKAREQGLTAPELGTILDRAAPVPEEPVVPKPLPTGPLEQGGGMRAN